MKYDLEASFFNECEQDFKANKRKQRFQKKQQKLKDIEAYIEEQKILEILQSDVWNCILLEVSKTEVVKDFEKLREFDNTFCDSSAFNSNSKTNSR